jgi:hypothetical protein
MAVLRAYQLQITLRDTRTRLGIPEVAAIPYLCWRYFLRDLFGQGRCHQLADVSAFPLVH